MALARELNARVGKVVTIQEYGGSAPWQSYNNAWRGARYGGTGSNQVSVQGSPNTGDLIGDVIAGTDRHLPHR